MVRETDGEGDRLMDRNKSAWGQGPKAASVTTNGAGRGGDVGKRQPKDSITQNMARKPSSDGNVGQRRGKSDFSEEVCCLPLFNSMVTAAQRLAAISIGLGHQRRGTSAPRSFFSILWHSHTRSCILVLCRVYGSLFTSCLL